MKECRLEGSAGQGLLFTGGVEAFEMTRCRPFRLTTGVRFDGPGQLQAAFTGNTTATVTDPVWIAARTLDTEARVRLRSNLFYAAQNAARLGPASKAVGLFRGSEGNWCNVGGCPTPTPGVDVLSTHDIGLDMGSRDDDAKFLRYPATSRLATAGPDGQPIGVPPE